MILIALTGGIGSGKSSVSTRLAELGAVIVDADAIVRELQAKGTPLLASLVERFGDQILTNNGELDRARLASMAFSDPASLADLNRLVHPAVAGEMSRRVDAEFAGDRVVVLDIPLFAENPRSGLAAVVVVDCPIDIAVDRLVSYRGFGRNDALARVAKQATRAQRVALATHVLDNSGTPAELRRQVDQVWEQLTRLPQTTADDVALYRSSPRRS